MSIHNPPKLVRIKPSKRKKKKIVRFVNPSSRSRKFKTGPISNPRGRDNTPLKKLVLGELYEVLEDETIAHYKKIDGTLVPLHELTIIYNKYVIPFMNQVSDTNDLSDHAEKIMDLLGEVIVKSGVDSLKSDIKTKDLSIKLSKSTDQTLVRMMVMYVASKILTATLDKNAPHSVLVIYLEGYKYKYIYEGHESGTIPNYVKQYFKITANKGSLKDKINDMINEDVLKIR